MSCSRNNSISISKLYFSVGHERYDPFFASSSNGWKRCKRLLDYHLPFLFKLQSFLRSKIHDWSGRLHFWAGFCSNLHCENMQKSKPNIFWVPPTRLPRLKFHCYKCLIYFDHFFFLFLSRNHCSLDKCDHCILLNFGLEDLLGGTCYMVGQKCISWPKVIPSFCQIILIIFLLTQPGGQDTSYTNSALCSWH